MIYSTYKYEENLNTFYVIFSNIEDVWDKYSKSNATYHLENALKKYYNLDTNAQSHFKLQITITDSKNDYLKVIALMFLQFAKGLGINKINTEGF